MMERKYQLVAWTENSNDSENARLYMIPSLESEVQASLIEDLTRIHKEEYVSHGVISIDLARRAIKAYKNMSRFEILTGHLGDGIRYLFFAAQYCIMEDECNWGYYDTDHGTISYFCGELRHELVRLCEEGLRLAKKCHFFVRGFQIMDQTRHFEPQTAILAKKWLDSFARITGCFFCRSKNMVSSPYHKDDKTKFTNLHFR